MSDLRLRELKAAAGDGPEQLAAYRRELQRAGLCPDCAEDHRPPEIGWCPGDGGGAEAGHTPGTRGRSCGVCRKLLKSLARRGPTGGPSDAGISKAAIWCAVRADPCAARIRDTLRAACPWPKRPRGGGDGYANARTSWQVWRKRVCDEVEAKGHTHTFAVWELGAGKRQPKPAPGQLDIFGAGP